MPSTHPDLGVRCDRHMNAANESSADDDAANEVASDPQE
jgi:hypothetical protein